MGKQTESDWLTSNNFIEMQHGRSWSKASKRKMRLFGCACCRRLENLLIDSRSVQALDLVEKFAEFGRESDILKAKVLARPAPKELAIPLEKSWKKPGGLFGLAWSTNGSKDMEQAHYWAAEAVLSAANKTIQDAFCTAVSRAASAIAFSKGCTKDREYAIQSDVLRDIFGNPFRPVAVDPSWLSWKKGKITRLARTMYDNADFDEMPSLGATLERAGCSEERILAHCRQSTPHVRGCWVVDLLLGIQ